MNLTTITATFKENPILPGTSAETDQTTPKVRNDRSDITEPQRPLMSTLFNTECHHLQADARGEPHYDRIKPRLHGETLFHETRKVLSSLIM